MAMLILALLVALALPSYQRYSERARNREATAEIITIGTRINIYRLENQNQLPDSLSEVDYHIPDDPWGRQYQYLPIEGRDNLGEVRKDQNLNPINTDFDLYSLGKDGVSSGPLTATSSLDDIVRANNGSFVGSATDY